MDTIVVPLSLFRRLLEAVRRNRRPVLLAVGSRRTPAGIDWLGRDMVVDPGARPSQHFRIHPVENSREARAALEAAPNIPTVVGDLWLGTGAWRGRIWGESRRDGVREPLAHLSLVGAGMHTVPLDGEPMVPDMSRLQPMPAVALERWSRTIGALGGEDVWRRLVSLRMCIVGCGRTGSLVAVTLARLGVRSLTIIDPDRVELHNVGEMDAVAEADVGRAKVDAVAECVSATHSGAATEITPMVASITDQRAIQAAKRCVVLISCVDSDAARLATAILATAHLKVHLEIGAGISFASDAIGATSPLRRTMGADVRLIVPGSCLLCRGGLTRYDEAVQELIEDCSESSRSGPGALRGRAGSLRSLNKVATGLAIQMLQDLIAERVDRSLWAHVEVDDGGMVTTAYPAPEATATRCTLCARAGLGDAVL